MQDFPRKSRKISESKERKIKKDLKTLIQFEIESARLERTSNSHEQIMTMLMVVAIRQRYQKLKVEVRTVKWKK